MNLQRVILISSNGTGSGKTTLATSLGHHRLSLASALRTHCSLMYPDTNFWDTSKEGKLIIVPETGTTVRQVLISEGECMKRLDPLYWCREWNRLAQASPHTTLIVDDLRTVDELKFFRSLNLLVTHFHLDYKYAVEEPFSQYAPSLRAACDYLVVRDDRESATYSSSSRPPLPRFSHV